MSRVGVVVIGRNEGERLRRCFESLVNPDRATGSQAALPIIYVDSGSADSSVELARTMGVTAVQLDLSVAFTAARARNTGLKQLVNLHPDLRFVQFVDGDCQVAEGWMETALRTLQMDEKLAVVCGRRRERFPDKSVYNRLCDIEWNTPVGEAAACGGDAMMRLAAIEDAGLFNPDLIAGEEPELCFRLREKGWRIQRIDAEMTLHDAAMTRFSQWWNRSKRAGHAYAEGAAMHGKSPERFWVKEVRSNWFWGLLLPLIAIGLAWPSRGVSLILLLGYAALLAKIRASARRRGINEKDVNAYAASCVGAKFPQMLGQLKYTLGRWSGRRSELIEYKRVSTT